MPLKDAAAPRKDHASGRFPATLEHRHFAVIAAIIRTVPDTTEHGDMHRAVAEHFANKLAACK